MGPSLLSFGFGPQARTRTGLSSLSPQFVETFALLQSLYLGSENPHSRFLSLNEEPPQNFLTLQFSRNPNPRKETERGKESVVLVLGQPISIAILWNLRESK